MTQPHIDRLTLAIELVSTNSNIYSTVNRHDILIILKHMINHMMIMMIVMMIQVYMKCRNNNCNINYYISNTYKL